MKLKLSKKQSSQNSALTVSDLRKSINSSFYGRSKIRLYAFGGKIKRFYRAYKLPTVATAVFLVILLSLGIVRQLERTSLLALIDDVTDGGTRYTSLLSADQADEFVRNDVSEDANQTSTQSNQDNSITQQTNTTQSNSTSFSLDTGSSNPVSSPPSSGENASDQDSAGNQSGDDTVNNPPSTTPIEPFSAAINSLVRGITTLKCNNPSRQNVGTCAKVYSFKSDIQTQNGPGSVSYTWQSNISSGNGNGSFSVGSGNAITAVSKEVSIACNQQTNFSIQIAILSPNTSSSNTININHNCNELK